MSEQTRVFDFVAQQIADPQTQWSIGTFGAIAEFSRDADEPVRLSRDAVQLSAVTTRGGIALRLPEAVRPVASESITQTSWNQRVALCLPEEECAMNRRTVLTDLGPDDNALREQDRASILFDLGLDILQADVCVRIADASVAERLREHVGRAVFEPGNPAMGIIFAANPHRVFVSRLGRAEVYQPIPPADGKSPDGPHTHVLPKLLQHRRTHAATEAIPDGFVPCGHLYPAHAVKDDMGRPRAFAAACHTAFQDMLREFGDPALVALKQRVCTAVQAAEPPFVYAAGEGRFARASIRIALRQMRAQGLAPPALAAWLAAYEPADGPDTDADAFAAAHGDH